jgi:hypothetical protein
MHKILDACDTKSKKPVLQDGCCLGRAQGLRDPTRGVSVTCHREKCVSAQIPATGRARPSAFLSLRPPYIHRCRKSMHARHAWHSVKLLPGPAARDCRLQLLESLRVLSQYCQPSGHGTSSSWRPLSHNQVNDQLPGIRVKLSWPTFCGKDVESDSTGDCCMKQMMAKENRQDTYQTSCFGAVLIHLTHHVLLGSSFSELQVKKEFLNDTQRNPGRRCARRPRLARREELVSDDAIT